MSLDPGHNPLYPHTELVRSNGLQAKPTEVKLVKTPVSLKEFDTDVKDLFGYGAGELHIYDPQDLPPLA